MKQKGFILVVSLIFMAVMSILAIYMFSGYTTDAVLSINTREKSRSLDAAQAAVNGATQWLQNNAIVGSSFNAGQACSGVSSTNCIFTQAAAVSANPSPNDPSTWTSYTTYIPTCSGGVSCMNVLSSGGAADSYASSTQYYIQYLGPGTGGLLGYSCLYLVTATAQGGNSTAVSVVQAVLAVKQASQGAAPGSGGSRAACP